MHELDSSKPEETSGHRQEVFSSAELDIARVWNAVVTCSKLEIASVLHLTLFQVSHQQRLLIDSRCEDQPRCRVSRRNISIHGDVEFTTYAVLLIPVNLCFFTSLFTEK